MTTFISAREQLVRPGVSQSGYASARLWLGISCVGATTVLAAVALLIDLPGKLFLSEIAWSVQDVIGLIILHAAWTVFLIPFEIYGGFLLPKFFQVPQFATRLNTWLKASGLQAVLFVATASGFLWVGRRFGVTGAVLLLIMVQVLYLLNRERLLQFVVGKLSPVPLDIRISLTDDLRHWGYSLPNLRVAEHHDEGFTGGVCGLPGRETIIIPAVWVRRLHRDELAALVARRIEACLSGGRSQGLIVALGWNAVGFLLATTLPGGGVQSVAELVTTCFGFTLWTFLGLLILPSFSRRSTYSIDYRVKRQGVPVDVFQQALARVQALQCEANHRPRAVESVFYPVPSLHKRLESVPSLSRPGSWNVARSMLFLSWAGMGFLSRAVHCNCGRPELWIMLPTD